MERITTIDQSLSTTVEQPEAMELKKDGKFSDLFNVIDGVIKNIDISLAQASFVRKAHQKFFPRWFSASDAIRMNSILEQEETLYSDLVVDSESGIINFTIQCKIQKKTLTRSFRGILKSFKRDNQEIYGIAWE